MPKKFLVGLAVFIFVFMLTGAVGATNFTQLDFINYNPYEEYDNQFRSSNSSIYDTLANYSIDGVGVEVVAKGDGSVLGISGKGYVVNNITNVYSVSASSSFVDQVSFSQGGALNIDYTLDGVMWVSEYGLPIDNGIMIQISIWQGSGQTGSDTDWVDAPVLIESNPAFITILDYSVFTGHLKPELLPGSPFIVEANKPYNLRLSLSGNLGFNPGYYDTPYDASSGFDFINTLNLTDIYLTGENGNKVSFTYMSSSGITYPTSGPPVPVPGTLLLLGSGILALAGVSRKKK